MDVDATKIDKWLVSQSFRIVLDHVLARRVLKKTVFKRIGTPKEPKGPYTSIKIGQGIIDMAWNKMGMKIKLGEPGPQFLCFLE